MRAKHHRRAPLMSSQKPSIIMLAAHPCAAVDLEDPANVDPLFELFHGTADDDSLPEEVGREGNLLHFVKAGERCWTACCGRVASAPPPTEAASCASRPPPSRRPPQERRAPAGVALRARLLSLFCRSTAAANCFPHSLTVSSLACIIRGSAVCRAQAARTPPNPALLCIASPAQTVTVCLYSPQTTPRLRQGGMEFAVWVHAFEGEPLCDLCMRTWNVPPHASQSCVPRCFALRRPLSSLHSPPPVVCSWVFKHAAPAQLAPAAASILDSLLQLLEDGERRGVGLLCV